MKISQGIMGLSIGLLVATAMGGTSAIAAEDTGIPLPAVKLECKHAAQYGVELKPFTIDLGAEAAYIYVARVSKETVEDLSIFYVDADLQVSYSESECEDSTDMFFVEAELRDLAAGKTKTADMILKHSSPEIELKGAVMTCRKI